MSKERSLIPAHLKTRANEARAKIEAQRSGQNPVFYTGDPERIDRASRLQDAQIPNQAIEDSVDLRNS